MKNIHILEIYDRLCKSYMFEGGDNQPKLDEEEDEGTTTTRIGENSELFR